MLRNLDHSSDFNELHNASSKVNELLDSLDKQNSFELENMEEINLDLEGMLQKTEYVGSRFRVEMNEILKAFNNGDFDVERLERFLEVEESRGTQLTNMSKNLQDFLQETLRAFSNIADRIDGGKVPTPAEVDDMFRQMTTAIVAVQHVTKVLDAPSLILQQTIINAQSEVESRIRESKQAKEMIQLERKLEKSNITDDGGMNDDDSDSDNPIVFYKKVTKATSGTQTDPVSFASPQKAQAGRGRDSRRTGMTGTGPGTSGSLANFQNKHLGIPLPAGAPASPSRRGSIMNQGQAGSPIPGVRGRRASVARPSLNNGSNMNSVVKPSVSDEERKEFMTQKRNIDRQSMLLEQKAEELALQEDELDTLKKILEEKEEELKIMREKLEERSKKIDEELELKWQKKLKDDAKKNKAKKKATSAKKSNNTTHVSDSEGEDSRASSKASSRPSTTNSNRVDSRKGRKGLDDTKPLTTIDSPSKEKSVVNDSLEPSIESIEKEVPLSMEPLEMVGLKMTDPPDNHKMYGKETPHFTVNEEAAKNVSSNIILDKDEGGEGIVNNGNRNDNENRTDTLNTSELIADNALNTTTVTNGELGNNNEESLRPNSTMNDDLLTPPMSAPPPDAATTRIENLLDNNPTPSNVNDGLKSSSLAEQSGGTIELITEMWSDLLKSPQNMEPTKSSQALINQTNTSPIKVFSIKVSSVGTSTDDLYENYNQETDNTATATAAATISAEVSGRGSPAPVVSVHANISPPQPQPKNASDVSVINDHRLYAETILQEELHSHQVDQLIIGGQAVSETLERLLNFGIEKPDLMDIYGLLRWQEHQIDTMTSTLTSTEFHHHHHHHHHHQQQQQQQKEEKAPSKEKTSEVNIDKGNVEKVMVTEVASDVVSQSVVSQSGSQVEESKTNHNDDGKHGTVALSFAQLNFPLAGLLAILGKHLPNSSRALLTWAAEQEAYGKSKKGPALVNHYDNRRRGGGGGDVNIKSPVISSAFLEAEIICAAVMPSLMALNEDLIDHIIKLNECGDTMAALHRSKEKYDFVIDESIKDGLYDAQEFMGSIKQIYLCFDSYIIQYRAVFDGIRRRTNEQIGNSMASSEAFKQSYDLFVTCQGRHIDLENRMASIDQMLLDFHSFMKATLPITDFSKINMSINNNSNKSKSNDNGANNNHMHVQIKPMEMSLDSKAAFTGPVVGRYDDMNDDATTASEPQVDDRRLHSRAQTVHHSHNYSKKNRDAALHAQQEQLQAHYQGKISELLEEIQDLKDDLLATSHSKDKTPGALLFFAALHDPNCMSAMNTMINQLQNLKRVADCSEHMEFSVLRRRLLVCISNTPPLERLITRYTSMYRKWSESHARVFSRKGQMGGDSDTAHTCPLCSNDMREMHSQNKELAASQQDMEMKKRRAQTAAKKRAWSKQQPPPTRAATASLEEDNLSLPDVNNTRANIMKTIKKGHW